MAKTENPDNQTPIASESAQPDNQAGVSDAKKNHICTGRRDFLRLGLVTLLGVAVGQAIPSKARADEYNPTLDSLKPVLQESLGGRETAPEKMDVGEMLIMDEAMQVLFRTMHHLSFWSGLAWGGKAEMARKTIETVINHENRGKFWYKRQKKDGSITIEKRKPGSPSAFIRIKDGVVTKIDDYTIESILPIINFDEEWKGGKGREQDGIDYKIKVISRKIMTRISPQTGRPPIIADWEYAWYSKYSMTLPRIVLKTLVSKCPDNELTPAEKRAKDNLARLIPNHPQSWEEVKKGREAFKKTGDRSKLKRESLIVYKQNASDTENTSDEDTPQGIYVIAEYNSSTGAVTPFAHVSKEGFIMEYRDGSWEKSDDRERPFFTMEATRSGAMRNMENQCTKELADEKKKIFTYCTSEDDEDACLERKSHEVTKRCILDKIKKILSGNK